jgi:hypothetical protein
VYFDGGTALVRAVERGMAPQTRIVVVLRDPAERLWTSYTDKMTRGRLPLAMTYDTFVDRCMALRANGTDRYEGNRYFRTLSGGFYRDHLPAWLSAFGSRARTVFAEDLASDPAPVVADLLRWLDLDLDPDAVPDQEQGKEPYQEPSQEPGAGLGQEFGQGRGWSPPAGRPPAGRRPQPTERSQGALGSWWAAVGPALRRASGRLAVPEVQGPVIARPHERTRCRVRGLYAEANRDLAAMLSGLGYQELPSWLRAG